ncbi:MAG: rhodanese-like domain-containing protein [Pseudomonadota bacterium]
MTRFTFSTARRPLLRRVLLAAAFSLAGLSQLAPAPSALAQSAPAPAWSPLIEPAALAKLAAEADPLILDIRGLTRKGGPSFYEIGHVPGAVAAPYGLWRGPAANPGQPLTEAAVTELLRALGAQTDRPTIVVSQGDSSSDFGAAARVYWTLKSAGVERIAILNGGALGWLASGRPLSFEATAPTPSAIEVTLDPRWTATRDEVLAASVAETATRLLDARPLAFFQGAVKHRAAKRAGTIATAAQLTHDTWFPRGSARIGGAKTVKAALVANGFDPAASTGAVSFCNTGHWAATNWFALSEIAGVENVRLYPESIVGWTRADMPVVKGESR